MELLHNLKLFVFLHLCFLSTGDTLFSSYVGCFEDISDDGNIVQEWASVAKSFASCAHTARLAGSWQFVLRKPKSYAKPGIAQCGWNLEGDMSSLKEFDDSLCAEERDENNRILGGKSVMAIYQFDDIPDEEDEEDPSVITDGDVAEGGTIVDFENEDDEDNDGYFDTRPADFLGTRQASILSGLRLGKTVRGPNGIKYSDDQIRSMLGRIVSSGNDQLKSNYESRQKIQPLPDLKLCSFIDGERICSETIRDLLAEERLENRYDKESDGLTSEEIGM